MAAPKRPSPYDLNEDDDNYMEGIDGEAWDYDGCNFYLIEMTIAPTGSLPWDPTALSLVPADYVPDDATEISEQLCALHSADEFVKGQWKPAKEMENAGPRRLRMLFAVHDGMHAAKFANFVTYFGHVDLPTPFPPSKRKRANASR